MRSLRANGAYEPPACAIFGCAHSTSTTIYFHVQNEIGEATVSSLTICSAAFLICSRGTLVLEITTLRGEDQEPYTCQFLLCLGSVKAKRVPQLLIVHLWNIHGFRKAIITDKYPKFASGIWHEFMRRLSLESSTTDEERSGADSQNKSTRLRALIQKTIPRQFLGLHYTIGQEVEIRTPTLERPCYRPPLQRPFSLDNNGRINMQALILHECWHIE